MAQLIEFFRPCSSDVETLLSRSMRSAGVCFCMSRRYKSVTMKFGVGSDRAMRNGQSSRRRVGNFLLRLECILRKHSVFDIPRRYQSKAHCMSTDRVSDCDREIQRGCTLELVVRLRLRAPAVSYARCACVDSGVCSDGDGHWTFLKLNRGTLISLPINFFMRTYSEKNREIAVEAE